MTGGSGHRLPGVSEAGVNFATARVTVRFDPALVTPDGLKAAVQEQGYDALLPESGGGEAEVEDAASEAQEAECRRVRTRFTFTRKEANASTAQVVLPDFGIVKGLPLGRPVSVEVTPESTGEYEFRCGMNMVRGRLVVTQNATGTPAQGKFSNSHFETSRT